VLGLDGFTVLTVREDSVELVITIETRDLACFGRPVRLVWTKRRRQCREELCDAKTWTEVSPAAMARQLITWRAGLEVYRSFRQSGEPV